MTEFAPPEIKQQVTAENFRKAVLRINASRQIRDDLLEGREVGKPIPEKSAQRREQIRMLIMESKQGEEGRRKGKEEIVFDVRGYQEMKTKAVYISPTGEKAEENLIAFVKLNNKGEPEIYTHPDGYKFLNADLYQIGSFFTYKIYNDGRRDFHIPRVGPDGQFTGTVRVIADPKK